MSGKSHVLPNRRVPGGMLTQAEEGMKLFEAQQGTAAEARYTLKRIWGEFVQNGGGPPKHGDEYESNMFFLVVATQCFFMFTPIWRNKKLFNGVETTNYIVVLCEELYTSS